MTAFLFFFQAWLIPINGTQFTSGFYAANPNSKIPAMMDYSDPAKPVRVFESGSIMLYLCDKPLSLQSLTLSIYS